MKTIIIFGSSRSEGNTKTIINHLQNKKELAFVNISNLEISAYDYEHRNQNDDFLPLMNNIVEQYDCILFATPIYWYSMSAQIKTFLDRLTDCITIAKATGRKLRGMKMALLSCSNGDDCPDYFHRPFEDSANYLGMDYLGHCHTWLKKETIPKLVDTQLERLATKL